MSQRAAAWGTWCLACLGLACGAASTEAAEPTPGDREPAGDDTTAADGNGAGLAGTPAGGSVERSEFAVDDAIEGGLGQPEGGPPPPPPDAGLPEALVLAEQLFAQADLAQAARLYEQVAAAPDNGIAAYAQYKLAWCRFNLQEFAGALEALVAVRQRLAAPATDQERTLRREAARDLPLFYAPLGRPDAALPFLQRVLDPEELAPTLRRLAQHYADQGRAKDAAVVRGALCHLRPETCAPGH